MRREEERQEELGIVKCEKRRKRRRRGYVRREVGVGRKVQKGKN